MEKYITKFIKRNVNGLRNQRVGILLATVDNGKIKYSWSLAKVRPTQAEIVECLNYGSPLGTDQFDEKRGLEIALARLNSKEPLEMPQSVRAELRDRKMQVKVVEKDGITGRVVKVSKQEKILRGFESRAKAYFKIA